MASSSSNNAAPLRPALLQKKKSREDVLRVDPETPARRVSFSIDTGRKDIFAIPNSTRSLDGLLHAHSSLSDFLPDKFRRGLRTPRSVINEFQDTVLHSKVSEMDCEQIEQILNLKSCDINARDPKKKATALVLATSLENEEKSLKICKLLVQHGASINMGDKDGYTCLHWAAGLGRLGHLELFCSSGAIVDHKSETGETALHRTSRFGYVECLKFLIDSQNASPFVFNKDQETVFDVAGKYKRRTNHETQKLVQESILEYFPSMKTLILHHPDCLLHDTVKGHQESAERVESIIKRVECAVDERKNVSLEISSDFDMVSLESVQRVHSTAYIELLLDLKKQVSRSHDPVPLTPRLQVGLHGTCNSRAKAPEFSDTSFSKGTLNAALRAAGSVCHAIDRIMTGKNQNSFCIVRPPGHHAGCGGLLTNSTSCGFCIFNSVMVGAMHALHSYDNVGRIAIVDIDAHHGNGTEDILRRINRPDNIFFASLHVYDDNFYPGTGKKDDLEINIFNSAIKPCWKQAAPIELGQRGFRYQMAHKVIPALRAFNPDLILVSAGFDGCKNDIGNKESGQREGRTGMDLSPEDYYWITEKLKRVATVCCRGRLVSVLEGGYGSMSTEKELSGLELDGFAACAMAHVDALSSQSSRPSKNGRKPKAERAKTSNDIEPLNLDGEEDDDDDDDTSTALAKVEELKSPPRVSTRRRVPTRKALSQSQLAINSETSKRRKSTSDSILLLRRSSRSKDPNETG